MDVSFSFFIKDNHFECLNARNAMNGLWINKNCIRGFKSLHSKVKRLYVICEQTSVRKVERRLKF